MSAFDIEALKALAGQISVDPYIAGEILDETGACADDLEAAGLRPLWACLESRARARQKADAATLIEALKGHVEKAVIVDVVVNADLGVTHQRMARLHEMAVRRRLIDAARAFAVAAKDQARPMAEVQELLQRIPELMTLNTSRVENCGNDMIAMVDDLEQAWSGKRPPTLRTGFDAIDDVLGGLIPNLHVIGAHAGVGKSALVAGLIRNWLKAGVRVGFLSYEDDRRDMERRIVALEAGVSLKHVRGDLLPTMAQRSEIGEAMANWSPLFAKLEADDKKPSGSLPEVVSSMRRMVALGCRVVVLDHLGEVALSRSERHDLDIAETLKAIRDIAKHHQIPVVVCAHMKRGATSEDETTTAPKLTDFAFSAAIERQARVALGLWREAGRDDGINCKVLKQTNGAAGHTLWLRLRASAAIVTNADSTERLAGLYGDKETVQ